MLVVAVKQSDGLEIEAVFQSLCPSFDAPVLTSPSGWKQGEQVVAQVVIILDYLFFLPVTSGVVDVLEGRYLAPCDALCRPNHPLESPAVVGGAVTVSGGDTANRILSIVHL